SGYPPYSGIEYNPGVGVDYWLWAVLIAGVGSTMSGINFLVTILKRRAPGMHLFRMPLFTWTVLVTSILLIFAFPALTVACVLLALDRTFGTHFFTNAMGGDMMHYINLFWLWGHPVVYILILPAFGVFSEVVATFSQKRLFGYTSLVLATMAIGILSFTVWLHHFFTMGSSADVKGYMFWFPKAFGFKLNETWGTRSFWCWIVGFYLAFMPLYVLGLMGMPRRMEHYDIPAWQPHLIVAAIGAFIILLGIICLGIQLAVSIRDREQARDLTGDPWNGRSLEWATSSPPAPYNFAILPHVQSIDAFWDMKHRGVAYQRPDRDVDIVLPKNTFVGAFIGGAGFVFGFGMVWYIWWLAILALAAIALAIIVRAFDDDTDTIIPASKVKEIEDARFAQLAKAPRNELADDPGFAAEAVPEGSS